METIIPSMFFKIKGVSYDRERLELDDGDFLDLDWSRKGSQRLIILTHGLEGGSDRYYIKRAVKYFNQRGWDCLAWNCRSCSGEMNRLPRMYHHGDTQDLAYVIDHVLRKDVYASIVLMGYSMGGSMIIKYLGERTEVDPRIKGAATFSVPCSLRDSSDQLNIRSNRIYDQRFLTKLRKKIIVKSELHPDVISVDGLETLQNFNEFMVRYTVPLHGFNSLDDFFTESTCDRYIHGIQIPVLIGNALNDPLLGEKCYPINEAQDSSFVFLDMPIVGGHCGFTYWGKNYSWMETRAEEFIQQIILKT